MPLPEHLVASDEHLESLDAAIRRSEVDDAIDPFGLGVCGLAIAIELIRMSV